MGVYQDLLDNAKSIKVGDAAYQLLSQRALGADPDNPVPAVDAILQIDQDATDFTGGDFTLTIDIKRPGVIAETFTTAAIAFDAVAATIEGAIDTAATGVVTGWTNGDIVVTGGVLQAAGAPVVLTFSGTSVAGLPASVVLIDSRTGGVAPVPQITVTAAGNAARLAHGALVALGFIDAPYPLADLPSSQKDYTAGAGLVRMPADALRGLMLEAAAEDVETSSYFALAEVQYGVVGDRKAPKAERIGIKTNARSVA